MQEVIKEIINKHIGKVLINEKLSKYTTYRVGGKCRAVVIPKGENELIELVKLLNDNNIKYFVLGNGSNVLFSDNLYDGIIIKMDAFNNIKFEDNIVTVGSGYSLIRLSNEAIKRDLGGLESFTGIPGTVGGAIFMNAGAYGENISMVCKSVRVLTSDLEIKEYTREEMEFSYRTSMLQKNLGYIVISCTLELNLSDKHILSGIVEQRRNIRRNSQPLNYPNAGSVFRNPEGMYAGRMIEDMGLKGYTVGRASVSEKHANFIINNGNCKASDIKKIIDTIKVKALNKYGVRLRVEQRLINWAGDINEEKEEKDKD